MARLDVDPTHFDAIFDPVRPDTGRPVTVAEARAGVPTLDDAAGVPGKRDRRPRIACAVLVLGNLIGTTLTHEAGHSLGLADPAGETFHDPGDGVQPPHGRRRRRAPSRSAPSCCGQGPGVFCSDEYVYLRSILAPALPGSDAAAGDSIARPDCN